ncbi:hypothetical protein Syun_002259 [Stephania yunnanensis]|uniref:Lipoxygenase domain-containing protein n=1 Tax=Stephania yunnanensis TaxID=152371 RepID=A0AAP0LL47_9MAGN
MCRYCQVAWRPVLEDPSNLQIFFDYYAIAKPPISKEAKHQRRRQELTQTTPDQPLDDEAVYYKVVGDCPKGCVYSLSKLHAVIPRIVSITNPKMGFPFFMTIDFLYNQGDRFSWLTDKEFARETLAGLNPYIIQLVKEWPLTSKLDPKLYGPPESAITKELVEKEISGVMTVEEAVEKKRLFMLDYHDLFLPYVNLVRDLGDTYLYGSRTLFFLRDNGTLQPIAIELTRPASNDQKLEPWKQVYTPTSEPTKEWLWKFAKLNVLVQIQPIINSSPIW